MATRVNQAKAHGGGLLPPEVPLEPAAGQLAADGGGRERAPARPPKASKPRSLTPEQVLADLEARVALGMGWVDLQATPSQSTYWGVAPPPQEGRQPVPPFARNWDQLQYVVLHLKRWGWFLELHQVTWYRWEAVAHNRREQVVKDGERVYTQASAEAGTLPEAICKVFCHVAQHRDGCMHFRPGALPIRPDEDIPPGCARCGKERESHP
jgi:hypothetical protein